MQMLRDDEMMGQLTNLGAEAGATLAQFFYVSDQATANTADIGVSRSAALDEFKHCAITVRFIYLLCPSV